MVVVVVVVVGGEVTLIPVVFERSPSGEDGIRFWREETEGLS